VSRRLLSWQVRSSFSAGSLLSHVTQPTTLKALADLGLHPAHCARVPHAMGGVQANHGLYQARNL
jgi:hypothetical protein